MGHLCLKVSPPNLECLAPLKPVEGTENQESGGEENGLRSQCMWNTMAVGVGGKPLTTFC